MKKFLLLSLAVLMACQPAQKAPQSFEELLHITDETDRGICDLALSDLRDQFNVDAVNEFQAEAFDYEQVAKAYPEDWAAQIRIIFRRAALKRRMNIERVDPKIAKEFYDSLIPENASPSNLITFHENYHYWQDRIEEQVEYGEPESEKYNIRFCVINEKRADLHATSRKDIMERIERGIKLPSPDLIENINHETVFDFGFEANMLKQLYSGVTISDLSAFERAEIRGRGSLLPFDPKTAEEFWISRDEEIDSYIDYIQTTEFSSPSEKLKYMTDIDQSLRRLFSTSDVNTHFENQEEIDTFKEGLFTRLFKVDAFNTSELESMLEGRGWFRDDKDGDGAGNLAWLVAQHADQRPDFQERVLTLIEAELGAPGVSKSNYAYLYDRVQVRFMEGDENTTRTQRYGTQGRCTGPGIWEPHTLEEPDRIDELRKEVGLGPIADYKTRFKDVCQRDER